MKKRQIPERIGKPKNQFLMLSELIKEELLFRNSLLRFREHLLKQMETDFDRILSGRLDAVDFLLKTCPIGMKNMRRISRKGKLHGR